jgi:exopolysaccharide biosynthesis protein
MGENNSKYEKDDNAQKEKRRPGKRMPVWLLAVTDIALTCICLGLFLLYHYILPRQLSAEETVVATVKAGDTAFALPGSNSTVDTDKDKAENTGRSTEQNTDKNTDKNTDVNGSKSTEDGSGASDSEISEAPEDTYDMTSVDANGNIIYFGNSDTTDIEADRSESEYISTQEKKVTQVNSYDSDNIQFTTDKVEIGSGISKITYYISDIYVSSVEYLRTAFAEGEYGKNIRESTLDQARDNDAILAINGDYYGSSEMGVVIRNGVLYRSGTYGADICVLFTDGTMKTYAPEEFDMVDILGQGAWQVWIFGPQLLDGEGNILSVFNSTYYLSREHPRTAIGYIEPGHYVFLLVDGRNDGYSRGASLSELAQIMADAGCVYAYNLDGGKSAEMVYEDEFVNQPSDGGREVSDIIYLRE